MGIPARRSPLLARTRMSKIRVLFWQHAGSATSFDEQEFLAIQV
jgi:hypothetical protein